MEFGRIPFPGHIWPSQHRPRHTLDAAVGDYRATIERDTPEAGLALHGGALAFPG